MNEVQAAVQRRIIREALNRRGRPRAFRLSDKDRARLSAINLKMAQRFPDAKRAPVADWLTAVDERAIEVACFSFLRAWHKRATASVRSVNQEYRRHLEGSEISVALSRTRKSLNRDSHWLGLKSSWSILGPALRSSRHRKFQPAAVAAAIIASEESNPKLRSRIVDALLKARRS